MKRSYPDRRKLETQCISTVAFVRNEGDVLDCPCWIMLINVVAMDILKSGTRKEDLLIQRQDLQKIFVLRRILAPMGTTDAIEFLIDKLKQTKTNSDFFDSMNT